MIHFDSILVCMSSMQLILSMSGKMNDNLRKKNHSNRLYKLNNMLDLNILGN